MNTLLNYDRKKISLCFNIIVLVSFGIRFCSGLSLYNLLPAVIPDVKLNIWSLLLGYFQLFPGFWNHPYWGLGLDISLILIALLQLKRSSAWLAKIFTILLLIYTLILNAILTHNIHYLNLMLVVSIAFWSKKLIRFQLLWEAARYYICFYYGSAFLYKVYYGAFTDWDLQLTHIKLNRLHTLIQYPNAIISKILQYFIHHPNITLIGEKIVYLLEGAFIIGFITKRCDKFLQFAALVIFISTYVFVDVFFIESFFIILLVLAKCYSKDTNVLKLNSSNSNYSLG